MDLCWGLPAEGVLRPHLAEVDEPTIASALLGVSPPSRGLRNRDVRARQRRRGSACPRGSNDCPVQTHGPRPTLPTVAEPSAKQARSLFEDTPAARRRLVLVLYAVVGPIFVGSVLFLGGGKNGLRPLVVVVALILSGALWVLVRRRPNVLDWMFPVAIVPTVCCGIAYATSGPTGDAFLALVGAPLACAAALFELPVMLVAFATAIPTVIVSLSLQMGVGAAMVSTLLLAPVAAIAGWVIFSSADQLRRARQQLQELATRDRALLRSIPDVVARSDRQGRVLDVHVPSKDGLPLRREDLVGRSIHDLVPGAVVERMRDALAKAFEFDAPQKVEYASPGPGSERFFEARLARSGPDEVLVIRRDVTERRRAEDERRFSAALVSRMQEAIIAVDLELKVTLWTGGAERIYGWTEAEVLGRPVASLVQPNLAGVDAAAYAASLAWRGTDRAVVRQLRKDGTSVTIDSNVAALHDADGNMKGYLAVCRDVTRQKAAEHALKESEARLRAYFESPAVGVAITSPEKGWIKVNDRVCSMLGYTRDELSRITWLEVTHPDDVAANLAVFAKLIAGEIDSYSLDKRFIRKDGVILWTLVSASCVRSADRGVDYLVSIFTDIGQRKQAEDALRESENRFRLLASTAPVGIIQTGARGELVLVNPTFLAMTGLSEAQAYGPDAWKAIHPEDRERVSRGWLEAVSAGGNYSGEYRHQLPDGKVIWVRAFGAALRDGKGAVAGYVGALVDITEARALQSQLAQASRLAAMGTLVAGVAHEINNPLAANIAGARHALDSIQEVRRMLDGDAGLDLEAARRLVVSSVESLVDAQTGSQRVAQIVKDLTTLGRPDPRKTRVGLRDIVDEALRSLPANVADRANITVEDQGAPDVTASPGQIEQVIVHLVTNAAKATLDGTRGVVLIQFGPGEPGVARLEVSDQGTGIEPAIAGRIFDPFFTTSDVGKGIGLGLSISHAIVIAHGGTLTVESVVGKGSRFRLELPAAQLLALPDP